MPNNIDLLTYVMRPPSIFVLFCQTNGIIFAIQMVELRRADDVSGLEGMPRVLVSVALSECLVPVNNVRTLVRLVFRQSFLFPFYLVLGVSSVGGDGEMSMPCRLLRYSFVFFSFDPYSTTSLSTTSLSFFSFPIRRLRSLLRLIFRRR